VSRGRKIVSRRYRSSLPLDQGGTDNLRNVLIALSQDIVVSNYAEMKVTLGGCDSSEDALLKALEPIQQLNFALGGGRICIEQDLVHSGHIIREFIIPAPAIFVKQIVQLSQLGRTVH
jgi:hypothetical protein